MKNHDPENKMTLQNALFSIVKKPLLHFIIFGAILYLLYGFLSKELVDNIDNDRTIKVSEGEISMMEDIWQKRWNRPPTDEELETLIQSHIKEMVYYRVALQMGLEKDDIRIRRLLGQKLQFITSDLIKPEQPDEIELKRYFKDNSDRYAPPEKITMTQIFFDPDKRGDQTLIDAENTLNILNKMNIRSVNVRDHGDQMMIQNYYPLKSREDIAKFFGSQFAENVFDLETKKWIGPILSGYGTHIVYLHTRQITKPPQFEEIRNIVLRDWMTEKQIELNELYYKSLLDRFEIVIEENGSGDSIVEE